MTSMLPHLIQFGLLCFFLYGTVNAQEKKPTLNDLAWLSGCWEGGSSSRLYAEHWMKPAGDMMLGVSRTIVGDKVVKYEYVRILRQDNGDIFYVANPSGQKEAWFKLDTYSSREVVFVNPEHDFPQRIIYRFGNDGSLIARIEGVSKGKERSVDFPMKRVGCD